jgi:hypothetical protein
MGLLYPCSMIRRLLGGTFAWEFGKMITMKTQQCIR